MRTDGGTPRLLQENFYQDRITMDSIDVLSLPVIQSRNKTSPRQLPALGEGAMFIHNNKIMVTRITDGECGCQSCYYADWMWSTRSAAHCPMLKCAGRVANYPYVIFKEVDHD